MKTTKRKNDRRLRTLSALITLGIVASLGFGVYSIVDDIRTTERSNIVDLNDTDGNVAMNVTEGDEPANAGATMDAGTDGDSVASSDGTSESGVTSGGDGTLVSGATSGSGSVSGSGLSSGEGMANSMSTGGFATSDSSQLPLVPGDDQDVAGSSSSDESTSSVASSTIANYSFGVDSSLVWPVYGDITLEYNMDSTVYHKSLGVYRCSSAMIISADVGTNVAVSASGVVTEVTTSDETGTTVTVAVGDGYEITYGLLDNVVVMAGNTVTVNQLLGTVAEPTAYYREEGPGVYYSVSLDGVAVDPGLFLQDM